MEESERILNIDTTLIGMWDTDTVSYFFHGMGVDNSVGELWIGPKGIPIADIEYQVFIKEGDPFIRIINKTMTPTQVVVYQIAALNIIPNELKMRTEKGEEIICRRHKV
jgi:hypothetical protein